MSRPSPAPTRDSSQYNGSSALGSPTLLTDYESLDIIGNGSFGIIRKVRRKADGVILARKELNFERMTERDRKQIVAEVNILKELQHDHIVRYHDRFVDRDRGILYILMEYCGGGDLSGIIKQSRKLKQPVPEDTIWAYFAQLLHALHYCHHPGDPLPTSTLTQPGEVENTISNRQGKQVILHRDLKPENVFLDSSGAVKLGDFGLSKAISHASFANTYVGTPYYMSPELINDSPYDTKSDIWSLGCLLYELCAWNPPFHAAQTHAELAVQIRSGRIPPLPKQYSSTLNQVIKAMLNLQPHQRPSAQMLMNHEKIAQCHQIIEAQKMISVVRNRRVILTQKEQQLVQREALCASREGEIAAEVTRLREEGARILAQSQQLEVYKGQFQAEVRTWQEHMAKFQQDAEEWSLVKEREREAMEKERKDWGEVMVRAQQEFEGLVAGTVEERAREMIAVMGREHVLNEIGEQIRGEERAKAEAAVRAEWQGNMQFQGQEPSSRPPLPPIPSSDSDSDKDRKLLPSRVPKRSLGKSPLDELPNNVPPFPARHLASREMDTPTRAPAHGLPPAPLVKDTPVGANRLASKSMTSLHSVSKALATAAEASPMAIDTPIKRPAGTGTQSGPEGQPTRYTLSTSEGCGSPSVSSAKKAARRMTTSSAVPRPPLPTHANTCPTAIPIWNPASLPPAPVWDLNDEENLPSPFIKKASQKAKSSTGPMSTAKKGLLAMAAANSAAEAKPPATGKEQTPPLPASTSAGASAKGPRLSVARAIRAGEENRLKLARRPL